MLPASRQYRSRNRQRPCDRCRQLKLKCQVDRQPPCQRCERHSTPCTFSQKHVESSTAAESGRMIVSQEDQDGSTLMSDSTVQAPIDRPALDRNVNLTDNSTPSRLTPAESSSNGNNVIRSSSGQVPAAINPLPVPPPNTPLFPELSLSTQISQNLDCIDGHHCQLFGGSSEADPWLLRHCRYDELGFRKFPRVHFRNAGGVPTRDKIPAHFMVSEDRLGEVSRAETRLSGDSDLRAELAFYVPPDCGLRLIRL